MTRHTHSAVEALREISTWRKDCHAHDADTGWTPRTFTEDDVSEMEALARQALAALEQGEGEAKCLMCNDTKVYTGTNPDTGEIWEDPCASCCAAPTPSGASWSEEQIERMAHAFMGEFGWTGSYAEIISRVKDAMRAALASLSAGEDQGSRAVPRLAHSEESAPGLDDEGREWFWRIVDAHGLADVPSDEESALWLLCERATPPAVGGVGWKLVPREPTEEMMDAWRNTEDLGTNLDNAKREWRAMYDAAPAQTEAEPGLREAVGLWQLLDDIDTASDVAKDDDAAYRKYVEEHHRIRFAIMSGEAFDRASALLSAKEG